MVHYNLSTRLSFEWFVIQKMFQMIVVWFEERINNGKINFRINQFFKVNDHYYF